ncbi:MAG: S49 family peptidase, partial [Chitinophagales bacterium]|nr:S49 family peptidase [Chitinophagales bacterium]
MSEYNRIQTRAFLDDMKDIMIDVISANRPLSREKIDNIMNELGGRTAEKSLENGLVDVIFYKDEMEDFLKEKLGVKKDKKLKTISLSKYNTLADIKEESKGKDKIAIVYAEGEIAYGGNEPGVISDERYMKMLRKIRNDDNIKAVVLRVNSPGGSAFASEMIWRELEQIKAAGKPVIASFGDYAASGGYYISSGADVIVSEPNTLTGSIGVFSILPDATKLFNDKLGINFDTVKTNDLAVGFSPFLPLSDKERALLQESTLDIYDLFLERVSKGRNLPLDST